MPKFDIETRIVEMEVGGRDSLRGIAQPSAYTCPECSGPILTLHEGKLKRYRCQVGHGYSMQTLLRGKYDFLEKLMAMTANAFEEISQMTREFAVEARRTGFPDVARRLEQESEQALVQEARVRQIFKEGGASWTATPASRERAARSHPRSRRGAKR